MKIAITADLHLKGLKETPERYLTLENICSALKVQGIKHLIIAGDLFDKDFSNYHDFDRLCNIYSDIKFLIIPGNHDYEIEQRFFTSSNIEIIKTPKIHIIEDIALVFIPYESSKSIDECLTELYHKEKLTKKWILISHGDYLTGNRELNPYESGFYMPLTYKAITKYNPLRVFLGHIHKPSDFGRVIYPGSPYPLDINETGRRRFIIYDSVSDSCHQILTKTDKIYFNESLFIFPMEKEQEFLEKKINHMIENWNINDEDLKKVVLRLSLKGFVFDLNNTLKLLNNLLANYSITLYDQIDTSKIKILKQIEDEKLYLFEQIKDEIINLSGTWYASQDKILEKATEIIFKD